MPGTIVRSFRLPSPHLLLALTWPVPLCPVIAAARSLQCLTSHGPDRTVEAAAVADIGGHVVRPPGPPRLWLGDRSAEQLVSCAAEQRFAAGAGVVIRYLTGAAVSRLPSALPLPKGGGIDG